MLIDSDNFYQLLKQTQKLNLIQAKQRYANYTNQKQLLFLNLSGDLSCCMRRAILNNSQTH